MRGLTTSDSDPKKHKKKKKEALLGNSKFKI